MHHSNLPYQTACFSLTEGDKTFTFKLPADPDAVFNAITEEEYLKDQFLPYWAERWPSAQVLVHYLLTQELDPCTCCCEIGCGLGVIATACAYKNVFTIATDISYHACLFAATNIRANGGIPHALCFDWRSVPLKPAFDLVVASDIVYEERWIDPVLTCIIRLLKPGGRALIADPSRRFWEMFKWRVVELGLKQRVVAQELINDGKTTVEVLEIGLVR